MRRAPRTLTLIAPEPEHRPATGALELALAEALEDAPTRAARATAVLVAALERIGELPASVEVVRGLAVGTRERLLQLIAAARRPAGDWREAVCEACGARYDVEIDLAALPLKAPGPEFPVVEVETSLGRRAFEVPNGHHEEALAARRVAGSAAARMLLALAGLDDDAAEAARHFSDDDLRRIDEVLEDASPEAAEMLDGTCPTCAARTRARIDPLIGLSPRVDAVLAEIHALAATYGWSERAILALPESRRRRYLALVDRERRQARRVA